MLPADPCSRRGAASRSRRSARTRGAGGGTATGDGAASSQATRTGVPPRQGELRDAVHIPQLLPSPGRGDTVSRPLGVVRPPPTTAAVGAGRGRLSWFFSQFRRITAETFTPTERSILAGCNTPRLARPLRTVPAAAVEATERGSSTPGDPFSMPVAQTQDEPWDAVPIPKARFLSCVPTGEPIPQGAWSVPPAARAKPSGRTGGELTGHSITKMSLRQNYFSGILMRSVVRRPVPVTGNQSIERGPSG